MYFLFLFSDRYNDDDVYPMDEWVFIFYSIYSILDEDGEPIGVGDSYEALVAWLFANNKLGEGSDGVMVEAGSTCSVTPDFYAHGLYTAVTAALMLDQLLNATHTLIQDPRLALVTYISYISF